MATLEIKKQSSGYFRFILDGDSDNAIIDNAPNLTSFGDLCDFKTKNGANLIKKQSISYADITYIDDSDISFTFASIDLLWIKLISEGFFNGLATGGGGGGVSRFDLLDDTFSYAGNDGKVPVVDQAQLKLVPTTFYNFKDFTQLQDVEITSLIEGKILSVQLVSGIPKIVLKDPPAETMQLANTVGFLDYNDLATHTTPLTLVANVDKKLTNDTLGAFTNILYSPFGVNSIWNSSTNSYDFTELTLGDTIDIRFDIIVTTTSANQRVKGFLRIGEGTPSQYDLLFLDSTFKTAGTYQIVKTTGIYLGSDVYRLNPGSFYVNTDSSGTCVVNGWYNRIIRVGVNVLDINIEEDDSADHYRGLWNASTNTPTLANGIGQVGDYYRVSVSGTQFSTNYVINDIIAFDGLLWYRKTNNNQNTLSTITRKTTTSSSLSTQDLAGFLTYVNGVTSFHILSNEHVIYEITDTGQKFLIYVNNRNVGSGETALTSSEAAEITRPNQNILQNLGVWVKFNQAAANAYPFTGAIINSGTIQGSKTANVNEYSNAYITFNAANGVNNSGARFTDGNSFPTTPFKGVTFFGIICPIVTTNLSAIIGMPASTSLTTINESTTQGIWFNITGNQIQAKCAYATAVSTASPVTIIAGEWLLCMIEVIDNDAINKKVRFKVKKIDGTVVYNADITSNIQPYNIFSNTSSTGVRAVLNASPVGNTDILGLQALGFWMNKPAFLNNF